MLSFLDGHEVSVMKCLRKLQDGLFSQTLPDGPPSSLSFFTVLPDYQTTRLRNPGLIRLLVWLMAPMLTCMWCEQCVSCPLITHEDTVVNGYLGLFVVISAVITIWGTCGMFVLTVALLRCTVTIQYVVVNFAVPLGTYV